MKSAHLFRYALYLSMFLLPVARFRGQNVSCPIQQPASDPAAQAFAAQDYGKALDLYSAAAKANPNDMEAIAGQVRSLLRQQQVGAAAALAEQSLATHPKSAVLTTVLGEVRYRQGRLADTVNADQASMRLDPCLARTRYDLYRIMRVESMRASAYQQLQMAHMLEPNDPNIHLAWIYTLPLAERADQIDAYLSATKNAPPKQQQRLENYADRLRAILAAKHGGCRLQASSATATTLPFRFLAAGPNQFSGLGFDVKVNNKAKARLELDTGASGVLLNENTARRAGLVAIAQDKIGGLGDKKNMSGFFAYADDLNVGGLEFTNCLVRVSDKKSILDVDGLIGADVFQNYHVRLDFPMRQMTLSPLPSRPGETPAHGASLNAAGVGGVSDTAAAKSGNAATTEPRTPVIHYTDRYVSPEMRSWSPFARVGHQILVNGRLKDGSPRLFLLDSGSDLTFLSLSAAKSVAKVHSDQLDRITGLSGQIQKVYNANNVEVIFAGYLSPFRDITVLNLNHLSQANGIEVSGILGLQTLLALTVDIDYRDGLINLKYDPKHGMNVQGAAGEFRR